MNLEEAFAEIQKRKWGFASDGDGFGDPFSTWTAVGPMKDGLVDVWGMDRGPIRAVEKALETEARNGKL